MLRRKAKRGSCGHMIPCGVIVVPLSFYPNLERSYGRCIDSQSTVVV